MHSGMVIPCADDIEEPDRIRSAFSAKGKIKLITSEAQERKQISQLMATIVANKNYSFVFPCLILLSAI